MDLPIAMNERAVSLGANQRRHGGGDGARMVSMQQQYTEQHGPSSLQAATFAWGNPYYTKVSLATLGDAPPDVAAAHLTRQSNLALANLLTEVTDDVLAWIGEADPEPEQLRAILEYERTHREREPIIEECTERLQKLLGEDQS